MKSDKQYILNVNKETSLQFHTNGILPSDIPIEGKISSRRLSCTPSNCDELKQRLNIAPNLRPETMTLRFIV